MFLSKTTIQMLLSQGAQFLLSASSMFSSFKRATSFIGKPRDIQVKLRSQCPCFLKKYTVFLGMKIHESSHERARTVQQELYEPTGMCTK